MSADLQPDVPDVLQEEGEPGVTVPVCLTDVRTPVRVQLLPDKGGSTRTLTATTTPVQVLWPNHWRRRALLMAIDQNIYVAFSSAAAADPSTMSIWPKGVPFPVDATTDVFVAAATATTLVSVTTALWAEGE